MKALLVEAKWEPKKQDLDKIPNAIFNRKCIFRNPSP